jgi:DNA-binding NarL/FixJ family response regulator
MTEISRTERLLAYLLLERMGDRSQEYKAVRLVRAGFSNAEIADLLETTTATVTQTLYVARGRSGKTSKAAATNKKAEAMSKRPKDRAAS